MDPEKLEQIQLPVPDAVEKTAYNYLLAERLIRIMNSAAQPGTCLPGACLFTGLSQRSQILLRPDKSQPALCPWVTSTYSQACISGSPPPLQQQPALPVHLLTDPA